MSAQQPPPSSSQRPVRRDIQGLRAVAVVGVVLAHATGWPRGGFAGVDVFFVVSGFLITGLLLRELADTGRISLRDFYARRLRRILPAAAVVLLAVAATGLFVFNQTRAHETVWDAAAALLVVANWRFATQGTDYFHAGDAVSPLQHFWSLSVEEQYYLVWPGLVLLLVLLVAPTARRRAGGRAVVGIAAAAVVAASLAWAFVQTSVEPTVAYFATTTRAWELGVGALLAVAAPMLARLPAALRWPLGWIGTAVVVWSFLVIDPDASPFPAPWALLPVAGAALVIAGGVGGDPRQRHLFPLTNPLTTFVGDLSYSLYLWHFPVIVFAAVLLPARPAATPIVLVAIGVLAVASYFAVEQPLHRSPWLRRRATPTEPDGAEAEVAGPASKQTATVGGPNGREAESAPGVLASTRPAGWVPGARYYPGSRPRTAASQEPREQQQAVAAQQPVAEQHPFEAEAVTPQPATLPPALSPALPPAPPPPPSVPTDAVGTWASWRARFGAQMGMSLAGLVVGAGLVVVLVFSSFGAPSIAWTLPAPLPLPAADGSAGGAAPATADPTGAVQAELSAAIGATSWPLLRPSLDQVMARSSADNPAHDCFSPDTTPDAGRCTWGDANAPRHMYLVGDSTAMSYAPAFKRLAEQSEGRWRVTTVGLYGCRFTELLVENSGAGVMAACPQRKADVRAMIGAAPADLVVVSNAYTLARTAEGLDLTATALIASSQAEAATYGAPGRIVYLAPPPRGGVLSTCYSPVSSPANCLTAIDPTWAAMHAAANAAATQTGDHALDARLFTCVDDVCPAFAGELPIRYDENHLTVAYAEHIAPVLRWQLSSLGLY